MIRTPVERMNFSLQIAKKFIEETLELRSNDFSIEDAVLNFIVIRDYPFLKEWEVQSVADGVKMMIDLYVNEQAIKQRKQHETGQVF